MKLTNKVTKADIPEEFDSPNLEPSDEEVHQFNFGSILGLITSELEVFRERMESQDLKAGDGELDSLIGDMLTTLNGVVGANEIESVIKQFSMQARKINSQYVPEFLTTLNKIYQNIPKVMDIRAVLNFRKALIQHKVEAQQNYTDPRVDSSQSVGLSPPGGTDIEYEAGDPEDSQLMELNEGQPSGPIDTNPIAAKLEETFNILDDLVNKFSASEFYSKRPTQNQKYLSKMIYELLKAKNLASKLIRRHQRVRPRA